MLYRLKKTLKYALGTFKRRRLAVWRREYDETLSASDQRDVFNGIYKKDLWGRIGQTKESKSGVGSTLKNTKIFRAELQSYLATLPPGTLLDAPCGDYNFMRLVDLPPGWSYIGADISDALLTDVRARYAGVDFRSMNLVTDPFPQADVWMCRACLFHLSYDLIFSALKNFASSSIPLAMITNQSAAVANRNITTGDYRDLNLLLPPFSLPPPIDTLIDEPYGTMAVWRRDQIATWLASRDTELVSSN